MNIFFLSSISIVVGFISALTGLGGASILTPILVLLGIPVKEAIASGMVAIIAVSSGSATSYIKNRITNVKLAMFLSMFTITGAIIGATITVLINPTFLYFFFAAFLLTSFFRLRNPAGAAYSEPRQQDRVSKWLGLHGSYYDGFSRKMVEYKADHALLGGLGMLIAGLAAGMLGIGAGAFKVTVQENILKLPPKVSSTTSVFIIGITALAGVSVYLFSGLLNLTLMSPMAIGVTIGAFIGGRVLNKVSDRALRVLFFVIIIAIIIQMFYKGISSL